MTAKRTLRMGVVAVAAAGLLFLGLAPAGAATTVRPGDQLISGSGQCTANFVFTNGSVQFIGLAAHCFGTAEITDVSDNTNGCEAGSLLAGSPVKNAGGEVIGTLAYSSWLTMQGRSESDSEACDYNDLALVRLANGVTASPTVPRPTTRRVTIGAKTSRRTGRLSRHSPALTAGTGRTSATAR